MAYCGNDEKTLVVFEDHRMFDLLDPVLLRIAGGEAWWSSDKHAEFIDYAIKKMGKDPADKEDDETWLPTAKQKKLMQDLSQKMGREIDLSDFGNSDNSGKIDRILMLFQDSNKMTDENWFCLKVAGARYWYKDQAVIREILDKWEQRKVS